MTEQATRDITTLDTREVYRNRWMRVREDTVRRPDGSQGIYGVVEKPDFAVIVPVEPNGDIHLVEQFRYPVGARFWEVPQGSWEDAPGADALAVARGELREETGLLAGRMTYAGHLFESYGYVNQGCHIFLAEELLPAAAQPEHEEQDLITQRFAAEDVLQMVRDGRIKDATTVAALGLLRIKGLIGF